MLLFMDGMAHYTTAEIPLKYTQIDTLGVTWSVVPEGRTGNCVKRTTTGGNAPGHLAIAPLMTRMGVRTHTNSGVCGFAVKVDDLQRVSSPTIIIPGATNCFFQVGEGAMSHVGVTLNSNGTFTLWRARFTSSVDKLAESLEGLQSGSWAYVEFKWFIDETAGTFVIRVNGVTVMDFTGNTMGSQHGSELGVWTVVNLLVVNHTSDSRPVILRMCDLYLADLTAPEADDVHDFLGDGTIVTIMPDGVGASTGWTPATAAPNWDQTNDRPAPDLDATYVSTASADSQDTYQFEDIPADAVVKGVHWNLLARKEDEGAVILAPVVRQGSTDYVGPSQGVASIAYDRYLTQPYDVNPATLAPWIATEVNAGQFGVKKIL